jgi:hypothetical protein
MIAFSAWAIVGIFAALGIIFVINHYFYDRRKLHDERQKKYELFLLRQLLNDPEVINNHYVQKTIEKANEDFHNINPAM